MNFDLDLLSLSEVDYYILVGFCMQVVRFVGDLYLVKDCEIRHED